MVIVHRQPFIWMEFYEEPQDRKAKREQLWLKVGWREEN